MTSTTSDVVIIGGGIIGCAIAYFLSQKKMTLTVLEKETVGGQASGGAAGMLGVQSEHFINDSLKEASLKSVELYENLNHLFKEECGINIGMEQNGILCIARNQKEKISLQNKKGQWVSYQKLKDIIPSINPQYPGGFFYPNDGQVFGARVCEAFRQSAEKRGAKFLEGEQVTGLVKRNKKVTALKTKNKTYTAGSFIVAGGAWSQLLLKKIYPSLPIIPTRGQLLIFKMHKKSILPYPVFLGESGFYLVPKPDGHLYVGTTVEKVGFRSTGTYTAEKKILQGVLKWLPGLQDLPYKGFWAGLRPQTKDGLPFIGKIQGMDNLWVSAGHFRRGILLAPFTGQALTQMILNQKPSIPMDDFSPGRSMSFGKENLN